MALLNTADAIRLGEQVANEVNVGENKVWPTSPPIEPPNEEEEPE